MIPFPGLPQKLQPKHKYHAIPKAGYPSTAEWTRAQELKLLERAGQISHLREQPTVLLVPRIPIKYRADFVYETKEGETIWEDVKGARTDRFRHICKEWAETGPGKLQIVGVSHGRCKVIETIEPKEKP